MAIEDIANRAKLIIYGSGLGEKPAIRIAAANANETVTGDQCTFDMATGEAAKVKAGNILSQQDATNENFAYVFYVLSIATDTITAINGYHGAPVITGADSGDLDDALLEQNPIVTMYEIFEAIDMVVAHMLWPHVYIIDHGTISSPDLVDGQEAVAATAKQIMSAQQVIGSTVYPVSHSITPREVHTTVASTGKLASFDWHNGSTGYYTYKRPITEADDDNEEVTLLIALGAAAIALGASIPETSISVTKKDNIEASDRRGQVADRIMRDFLTLRQNFARELEMFDPQRIHFDRG